MYQQYFDEFYQKSQARLLKLGTQMALDYKRGEIIFIEAVAECRDLRRARRAMTALGLTDRQKYDMTLKVIDIYRLDEGLNINLDFICIETISTGIVDGNALSGLVVHNETLDKQGGMPSLNEFYHLSKSDFDYIRSLRFIAPTISFPGVNFGSVLNVSTLIPNDGVEKGATFAYSAAISIAPNQGVIQSIKVFKTQGTENPIPVIDTLTTSFTLTDSISVATSFRLEVRYLNTSGNIITSNTVRSIPFYYPTFIGVGVSGLTEVQVKAQLEKHIWANADRRLLKFNVNSNKIYFLEPYNNSRRIIDVAINYTTSFIYTNPVYTLGGDPVTMDSAEFVNNLVPDIYQFDFLLV